MSDLDTDRTRSQFLRNKILWEILSRKSIYQIAEKDGNFPVRQLLFFKKNEKEERGRG